MHIASIESKSQISFELDFTTYQIKSNGDLYEMPILLKYENMIAHFFYLLALCDACCFVILSGKSPHRAD